MNRRESNVVDVAMSVNIPTARMTIPPNMITNAVAKIPMSTPDEELQSLQC